MNHQPQNMWPSRTKIIYRFMSWYKKVLRTFDKSIERVLLESNKLNYSIWFCLQLCQNRNASWQMKILYKYNSRNRNYQRPPDPTIKTISSSKTNDGWRTLGIFHILIPQLTPIIRWETSAFRPVHYCSVPVPNCSICVAIAHEPWPLLGLVLELSCTLLFGTSSKKERLLTRLGSGGSWSLLCVSSASERSVNGINTSFVCVVGFWGCQSWMIN